MKQKNILLPLFISLISFQISAVQILISRALSNTDIRFFEPPEKSPIDTTQVMRFGEVIHTVKCAQQPDQSYALYLPMSYLSGKQWPIIYIFDPAARGNIPIELMKDAAEHYGFIIAASNNSRNGPWEPEAKAAKAMWDDTHSRFSVDDSCVYFAGFSGGARVAAYLAQSCQCAQGVLLNGAGFSSNSPPSFEDRFAVFATVGFTDMNYDEMARLDKTLDTLGISHTLRRFEGSHQWGPEYIWREAFAWIRLVAMKNGRQTRDENFIAAELAAALQRAQVMEDLGDVFFAWQNYREISNIFKGLADTKKIDDHIAALEKNDAVIEGQQIEEKEILEQIGLQNKVLKILAVMHKPKPKWLTGEQLNNYSEGGLTFSDLRAQARANIRRLRNNIENEDKPGRRRSLERARGVIFSSLMETAKFDMNSNDLPIAMAFFELAAEAQPDISLPHISLARCHIRIGDKEESIQELSRARETGMSAQALSDISKQIPELSSLIDDPEFQKLIKNVPPGGQ